MESLKFDWESRGLDGASSGNQRVLHWVLGKGGSGVVPNSKPGEPTSLLLSIGRGNFIGDGIATSEMQGTGTNPTKSIRQRSRSYSEFEKKRALQTDSGRLGWGGRGEGAREGSKKGGVKGFGRVLAHQLKGEIV